MSCSLVQVLAAVSNARILPMLGQFVDIVTARANCTNFLVVALDEATSAFLTPRKARPPLAPEGRQGGSLLLSARRLPR